MKWQPQGAPSHDVHQNRKEKGHYITPSSDNQYFQRKQKPKAHIQAMTINIEQGLKIGPSPIRFESLG
jgi:hypothetical protein